MGLLRLEELSFEDRPKAFEINDKVVAAICEGESHSTVNGLILQKALDGNTTYL